MRIERDITKCYIGGMVKSLSISKTIVSLADLHARLGLWRSDDRNFFTEWSEGLSDLSESQQQALDRMKRRFDRHRDQGLLTEGTINLLLVEPLLKLAGFYDEPFWVKAERSVEILLPQDEAEDEVLRGRIDALVIQDQFWVLVVESKRTLSFAAAIPQALTYMVATPDRSKPIFSLVTDGDIFIFIKLDRSSGEYDLSDTFSLLFNQQNKLYGVLKGLNRMSENPLGLGHGHAPTVS